MKKVSLGIIGCGNIGEFLVENLNKDKLSVINLYDIDLSKASALKEKIKFSFKICMSLRELIENSDLVVEAAGIGAVDDTIKGCIKYKKDAVIMSVGALVLNFELYKKAKESITIYIPEGAVFGLDIFKSLKYSKIHNIVLTTYKPPQALAGAPFLEEKKIDVYRLTDETLIFEGSLKETITNFPQNINVAGTLAINSGVPDKIKVKIVCSPFIKENIHHILIESEAGRYEITSQNKPSPHNPKTSALALFSCLGTTEEAVDNILKLK